MKKEGLMHRFHMPLEQADYPHFEMNGASQLLADGCLGIVHYDACKVCLNCDTIILEIEGEELSLNSLGNDEAEVRGKISSVKFQ